MLLQKRKRNADVTFRKKKQVLNSQRISHGI